MVYKSCHVVIGFSDEGEEQILGFLIQKQGATGVKIVISDAHKSLVAAIKKVYRSYSWQKCQVRFMRNILSNILKKDSNDYREKLKNIFRITDIEATRETKNRLIEEYAN